MAEAFSIYSFYFYFVVSTYSTLIEMSQLIQIMCLSYNPTMETNTTGFGAARMRSIHSAQYLMSNYSLYNFFIAHYVFGVSLFHPVEASVCFSPFLV